MRLITWNCQGAFRKKYEVILSYRPDVLVVPECEHPDKFVGSKALIPNDFLWLGDNINKGLGIFSFCDLKFQLKKEHNPNIRYISPILVSNEYLAFTLFAIWANNRNDPDGQYVEQVWKAINYYDQLLNIGSNILIGDFNSNKIWDRNHRMATHSGVVDKLAKKNIISVYHNRFSMEQGSEVHPTFYLQRNKRKPYHIDYCFTSNDLYEKIVNFEVGTYEKWIHLSDHTPLIIDFIL